MLKKRIKSLSNFEIIAFGFLSIIMIGTILLMLPISSIDGMMTHFEDALFTATSACCVTGLVVFDTASHWSFFGQVVILILIQIGGLGFITLGVFLFTFLPRKISLRQRGLIEESMNTLKISGGVLLVKHVIKGIILATVFIPYFGLDKGIYYSIFHSVSAFCNAGFDLMGYMEPYGSLTMFSNNVLVLCTIMALIIIGGIGFIVWEDLYQNTYHYKKYMLQTRIVLCITTLLIIVGAGLFFICEKDLSLKGMPVSEQILNAFFQSVTCRTAGFNSIDTAHLSDGALGIMTLLMFIGDSPGSTAGGIKTTSFVVISLFMLSVIKNEREVNVFHRRLSDELIKKAFGVFMINITLVIIGVLCISIVQPELSFTNLLFEVVSAIGTVGISTGITRSLNIFSRAIIIFMMYAGRVGTLTFALSFTGKKKSSKVQNPIGRIAIG